MEKLSLWLPMVNKKMQIKTIFYIFIMALFPLFTTNASGGITKNNAQMQAMDKITGRVSVINVPVNGVVEFGSLSIVVRSCKTRPAEEAPDNFAFVDITDKTLQGEEFNIFKGWMISSSPATHAVEHPIYDVWLLQCTDEKNNKKNILTEEQLSQRDNLPMKSTASSGKKNLNKDDTSGQTKTISEMENDETRESSEIQQQSEFFYDEEESAEAPDTIETEVETDNTSED